MIPSAGQSPHLNTSQLDNGDQMFAIFEQHFDYRASSYPGTSLMFKQNTV